MSGNKRLITRADYEPRRSPRLQKRKADQRTAKAAPLFPSIAGGIKRVLKKGARKAAKSAARHCIEHAQRLQTSVQQAEAKEENTTPPRCKRGRFVGAALSGVKKSVQELAHIPLKVAVEVGIGQFNAKVELRKTPPPGSRRLRMLSASRISSPARRALSFNPDPDANKDRSEILQLPPALYESKRRLEAINEEPWDSDEDGTEDMLSWIQEVPDLEYGSDGDGAEAFKKPLPVPKRRIPKEAVFPRGESPRGEAAPVAAPERKDTPIPDAKKKQVDKEPAAEQEVAHSSA